MCYRIRLGSLLASVVCGFSQPVMAVDYVKIPQDPTGGGYQAFPDVTRLQDGRLMCVFYNGYWHVSTPNSQWPKGGRIDYSISTNEGYTWSTPTVLYNGDLDERDPSITQLSNGQLLCSYYDMSQGASQLRSFNAGGTWSSPELVAASPYYVTSPARRLSNGRLAQGLYYEDHSANTAFGAVVISGDNVVTSWSSPINIPKPADAFLDAETDLIELKNESGSYTGNLYAVERTGVDSAYFSTSTDYGNTWSMSQQIGFNAHCPYLHRAPNGAVLLVYRDYTATYTQGNAMTALRYSFDECKTWSPEVVVDSVYGGAYPSIVDLNDGTELITYYEEGDASDIRVKRFRATTDGIEWLPVEPMHAPEPGTISLLVTAGIVLMVFVWQRRRGRTA
jgi:sialidase-1